MTAILRKPIAGLMIGLTATIVGVGLCISLGAGFASAATSESIPAAVAIR